METVRIFVRERTTKQKTSTKTKGEERKARNKIMKKPTNLAWSVPGGQQKLNRFQALDWVGAQSQKIVAFLSVQITHQIAERMQRLISLWFMPSFISDSLYQRSLTSFECTVKACKPSMLSKMKRIKIHELMG